MDTLLPHVEDPLAEVRHAHGGDRVRLPPALAEAALKRFAKWGRRWHPAAGEPDVVIVDRRDTALLLRALEDVKPPRLGADGSRLPWSPPRVSVESLAAARADEDDAVSLGPGAPLPSPDAADGAPEAWLAGLSADLCAAAGVPEVLLQVAPGMEDRRGFCAGRVWLPHEAARPARVRLRPCPNSDHAEIAATLIHEIAHVVAPKARHGDAFKGALIDLAGRRWGPELFVCADARQTYPEVDRWIAVGIRAALEGRPAPVRRTGDEGDTARVVSRIRKLRALAADQVGGPEAIAATARANHLVTTFGLGGYEVQIAAGIDDQMVDRFAPLRPRTLWQRQLSAAVGSFFGVFSLSMSSDARMHFFGRHADVVATAFLVEVSIEKIERACEAWIGPWKRRARPTAGEVRGERVAFCDNAVIAFAGKLRDIRAREKAGGGDEVTRVLRAAERFARVEHEKRGLSWGAGSGKQVRHHAAGAEAGGALSVAQGVGGSAGPRAIGRD